MIPARTRGLWNQGKARGATKVGTVHERADALRDAGLADSTQTLELWSASLHTRRSKMAWVYSLETPLLPADLQDSTLPHLPKNRPEALPPH